MVEVNVVVENLFERIDFKLFKIKCLTIFFLILMIKLQE